MTVHSPGSASPGLVVAPAAPGRLGEAAGVQALSDYLAALTDWTVRRKAELDLLDSAVAAGE